MLKTLAKYFYSVPPVFMDGTIYVLLAVLPFFIAGMNTDEGKQFIPAFWRWLITFGAGCFNVGLVALKSFRSTAYSDHIESLKEPKP